MAKKRRSLGAAFKTKVALEGARISDPRYLPLEEVVEIRNRRAAELEAFRGGLAQVVSQLDPALRGSELQMAMQDMVDGKVKPALRDLNAAIESLERQARRELWDRPCKKYCVS